LGNWPLQWLALAWLTSHLSYHCATLLGASRIPELALTISTISVPRLNDQMWDFQRLHGIWQEAFSAPHGNAIHFEFSRCDFLRPNAVVILGGLARMLLRQGRTVMFLGNTMRPNVLANLTQNGFATRYGCLPNAVARECHTLQGVPGAQRVINR